VSVSDRGVETPAPASGIPPRPVGGSAGAGASAWLRYLSPRKIGAVYFLILIVVFFSLLDPESFPHVETIRNVFNEYSVSGIMALGVIITLSSGLFDLSVGYTMGFTGTLVAWLLAYKSMGVTEAIVLTTVAGVAIGLGSSTRSSSFSSRSTRSSRRWAPGRSSARSPSGCPGTRRS
jgi:hypothetical protein